MQAANILSLIGVPRMWHRRQNQLAVRSERSGLDILILAEPLSIRFAMGARNYDLIQMHIQAGYPLVPAEGLIVHFDSEPGLQCPNIIGPFEG